VGGTARLRDHYDALARGASSTLLQPRRHAAFHDNTLLIITSLSSPSSLSFVIVPAGGGWLYITIVSPNVFFQFIEHRFCKCEPTAATKFGTRICKPSRHKNIIGLMMSAIGTPSEN